MRQVKARRAGGSAVWRFGCVDLEIDLHYDDVVAKQDSIAKEPVARLLVSVVTLDEVEAALAGGADIVDVKNPAEGSLGGFFTSTMSAPPARAASTSSRVTTLT